MVDASEKKVITLMTSNGDEFEVEKAVAMESQTIRHMIESDCTNNRIPIPNIKSKILSKVIEYCNKHVQANPSIDGTAGAAEASTVTTPAAFADDLKNWDAEFVNVDQTTVFNLILAASYLNIKGLMNLACQTALDMIKGKTSEEIRKNFNFPNDYTPKRKETLLVNNERAFDWKSI